MTTAAQNLAQSAELATPEPTVRLGRFRLYLRRYLRNRSAVLGLALLVLLIAYALFGHLLASQEWHVSDFTQLTQPPSREHPFGTNQAGNDVLAQSVQGLRRSLVIAITVSVASNFIAAIVGAGAAYLGGRIETAALAVIHFLLVVPSFLILALVSNRAGGDIYVLILVLTVFGWMGTARVIWAMSTSLRERDWVLMAKFMGVPSGQIVTRHIVPHLGALLILNLTLGVVGTVLSETALSFLGFGVRAPDVSLGSMLAVGSTNITHAPWLFAFPAALLVLFTVSMTLIGDGLRDALDPTSNVGGRG